MTPLSNDEPTVQQLFDLTGKVVLITGGSGHLGRSMASALAEASATVVVSSRDESRAQTVADELARIGDPVAADERIRSNICPASDS